MRDNVRQDVLKRLKQDFQFKQRDDWLRGGVCPNCTKKEVFTHATTPWTVKCGRLNKCGWESDVKTLYPDAFERFNERFRPASSNPTATADAYMEAVRGLPVEKLRGWYRQGNFTRTNADRDTATVLFDIDRAAGIAMERFVEPVTIKDRDGNKKIRKQNFLGRYQGLWWAPPGLSIEDGEELWLVEGCIDAISLAQVGKKAVALLTCYNYPEKRLADIPDTVTLVWALDSDTAGKRETLKHVRKARKAGFNCVAAQIPERYKIHDDWNDVYRKRRLTGDDIALYRHHGDLLLAESPFEKGLLIWRRDGRNGFAVEFSERLYWFDMNLERYQAELDRLAEQGCDEEEARERAARSSLTITTLSNCVFRFLYFQANRLTDEAWYYARVEFPIARPTYKGTFTSGQVSASPEFKKRLLHVAPGGWWQGKGHQFDWIMQRALTDIRVVETIDYVGYSKEHEAYIFKDICIAKGRIYPLNDDDYFEVGAKSVKTLNKSLDLEFGKETEDTQEWLGHLYTAFGPRGIIALAFFLGTLYAEQIRARYASFPFLEIVGEAGAGKTTLIEFLWKLMGRPDYEGIDPNKSTLAGRSRAFVQTSNLPVSLIESDREMESGKLRQFDWDELKTAFNGRSVRTRGIKNGGNDTDEPPFRGSILISQNAPVMATEAILTRIVHLYFDRSQHTPAGKAASDALSSLPVTKVSRFLINACLREDKALATLADRIPMHERNLEDEGDVRHQRLVKNHAQMLALIDVLHDQVTLHIDWRNAVYEELHQCAAQRQQAIATDSAVVAEFWEAFDFMSGPEGHLNHAARPDQYIALNLNHVQQVASEKRQNLPDLIDLKNQLRSSKSRTFEKIKNVRSRHLRSDDGTYRVLKCWVFKRDLGS